MFIDSIRVVQFARDHDIVLATAYQYLHEGTDALVIRLSWLRQWA